MDLVRPFPTLTDDQRALVMEIAQPVAYGQGDIIIEQDKVPEALYVVVAGNARLLQRRSDAVNAEFTGPLGPGDLFGEISFVDGKPASATIVADGDVSALWIDSGVMRGKMAGDAALAANVYHSLLAIIARRLRSTNMRIVTPVDFE